MLKKFVIIISALVFSGLTITACTNTAEGIGRDVERAGEKIQNTF